MFVDTRNFVDLVDNRYDAEYLIAGLIAKFSGPTAQDRLAEESVWAKQSADEVARRTASNLLTSFTTRRNQVG